MEVVDHRGELAGEHFKLVVGQIVGVRPTV
jgi:hypothetical protein